MKKADRAICTIVAKNYFAHLIIWLNSIMKYEPDSKIVVLVIDIDSTEISKIEFEFQLNKTTVISPSNLSINNPEHFFAKYDILEVSTAIKPYLLEYILKNLAVSKVIFLDPDIVIYNDLSEVWRILDNYSITLTPHIVNPVSASSNMRPNERDYLRLGCANLGFIGVSSLDGEYEKILSWWQNKLYYECTREQESGVFLDQRWADIMPFIFNKVHINRQPDLNVAWWNLSERFISSNKDIYYVNGIPLTFFHFSGYSPDYPDRITHHISNLIVSEQPDAIRFLYLNYKKQLLQYGYEEHKKIKYKFDYFPDHTPVSYIFRLCIRKYDPLGKEWNDPLNISDLNCFRHWITEPLHGRLLSRYALMIYERYSEIQEAFPVLDNIGEEKYLNWLRNADELDAVNFNPIYTHKMQSRSGSENLLSEKIVSLNSLAFFDRCSCGRAKPGIFS